MSQRKRPHRRIIAFRCPGKLLRQMDYISRQLRGGRSAFMVAALLALVNKLAEEGGVRPMPAVPPAADYLPPAPAQPRLRPLYSPFLRILLRRRMCHRARYMKYK